jgi:hypothetical protein
MTNSSCVSKIVARLALFALCAASLAGCASLSRNGGEQAVYIRSEPPGASVEVGGQVVGKTPTFVILDRKRHPDPIRLLPPPELKQATPREIKLQTRYRWGQSFAGGFGMAMFAPVSWGVDFLTGSAWQIQDPPPEVLGKIKNPLPPASKVVAIAPPVADSLALSEIAASALEDQLQSNRPPGYTVLPYKETLPTFLHERFDFDGPGNANDRRLFLMESGATIICFSHVERNGDDYVLKVELRDGVDDKVIVKNEIILTSDDDLAKIYGRGRSFYRIFPNTVGLNYGTDQPSFQLQNESIDLVPAGGEDWWQTGLQYLSSVSLTSQPVYRSGRGSRWVYSFVPAARGSIRKLKAVGSPLVDGQVFERWLLFGGYGVEGGYQFGRHYIYASLIPGFVWSDVKWHRDGKDNSVANTQFAAQFEFGYLWSITEAWNIRFYLGSYAENNSVWSEALRRTARNNNAKFDEGSANATSVGIIFGYNFEAAARKSYQRLKEAKNIKKSK